MESVVSKIWLKKNIHGEEIYTLSNSYAVEYFPIDTSDTEFTKQQLNQIRKDYKLYDRNINKYPNCDLFSADVIENNNKTELPKGMYYYSKEGYSKPEGLASFEFRNDEYLNIFNKAKEVEEQINLFINNEKTYRDLNIIYKMGILWYGPPGEGKTSFIRNLVNSNIFCKDAIVINITEELPESYFLQSLNSSTKGKLKILILEEITNLTQHSSDIRKLLTFLDGETSLDNCIILATTNYPELLPKNIVERPSRFDKLYKMSSPNKEEIFKLIEYYYKKTPSTEEINGLHSKSTAYIKEVCINALLNKINLMESIENVKKIFNVVRDDFTNKKMGIAE